MILAIILRWLTSLNSYSGYNDKPMFGDYEAQRHWMEITLNLPIFEWYFHGKDNDLMYWGIDYPPISSYLSCLFGYVAKWFVPDMVALYTSRGIETESSKLFMRSSVIVMDVLVYFPAVYLFLNSYFGKKWNWQHSSIMLMNPAMILIDHGHFQYNCVCIGWSMMAIVCFINGRDVLGSVFYCLALNFKQMTLYYAPAIGIYILANCWYTYPFVKHFCKVGGTVILSFLIIWMPLLWYTPQGTSAWSVVKQVLHRVFPFGRGLFEDKVANFWCLADVVFKLKLNFTNDVLVRFCLVATLIATCIPSLELLRSPPTRQRLLLAVFSASMAFFLFSYQVHEKTILIPLMPMILLFGDIPLISMWLSIVATFSMSQLLKRDGLWLPYLAFMVSFAAVALWLSDSMKSMSMATTPPGYNNHGLPHMFMRVLFKLSLAGMVVLHALEKLVVPPSKYPHIFNYMFALYSFAHFGMAYVYCVFWQYKSSSKIHKQKKI